MIEKKRAEFDDKQNALRIKKIDELTNLVNFSNDEEKPTTTLDAEKNSDCLAEKVPFAVNVLINPFEDIKSNEDNENKKKNPKLLKSRKASYVSIESKQIKEDEIQNFNSKTTISSESVDFPKPFFYVEKNKSRDSLDNFKIDKRINIKPKSEKNLLSVDYANQLSDLKKDNTSGRNCNRLSAVAKEFFRRRRSHQNCLISTANENGELEKENKITTKSIDKTVKKNESKDKRKKKKSGGIEAMLRQSCVDVRNLIVGDSHLFGSPSNVLPTPMALFHKGRRQSTTALFQPGPRISPLPFEHYNGAPGSRF